MEHVVFYQSAQGAPAFRRVGSLEDAVSFAEHLRNVENITDFSVYSLSPVTLSMRAYYHVEVTAADAGSAAPAPQAASAPAGAEPDQVAAPEPSSAVTPPPLPPPTPPADAPFQTVPAAPAMSFNALEQEASAPAAPADPPAGSVPFAAAPLPPTGAPITETFVKDDPPVVPAPSDGEEPAVAVDPNVVDPTTEEVVPAAPPGRRSMGFFARS